MLQAKTSHCESIKPSCDSVGQERGLQDNSFCVSHMNVVQAHKACTSTAMTSAKTGVARVDFKLSLIQAESEVLGAAPSVFP